MLSPWMYDCGGNEGGGAQSVQPALATEKLFSNLRARKMAPWIAFIITAATAIGASPEPGLLFYLSGEKGTTADFSAAGRGEPTFDHDVTRIPDGASGAALQCGDLQLL